MRAIGIAMDEDGGLIVWQGQSSLSAIPIDRRGEAAGEAKSLRAESGDLATVAAVREGFVAVFADRCEAETCLAAQYLERTGAAAERRSGPSVGTIWTRKQVSTGTALVLALGHEDAPPEVLSFAPGRDIVRTELPAPPDTRTEVLGLSPDGDDWAALYRVGAAEGAESHVALARSRILAAGGEGRIVESLHDALAIESFAASAAGLSMIASFEFSRPRLIAFSNDGETEPLLLAPGRELPPPFEGRRRARARIDDGALVLDVETGAGDPVERGVTVLDSAGNVAADLARLGPAELVVAAAPEGRDRILTFVVRCD
jgi:hypothetical protein